MSRVPAALGSRPVEVAGVTLLLAALGCLTLWGVLDRSATFDEPAFAAGGTAAWRLHDFRLNAENGILPQRLAGLGLWGARFPSPEQPAFWASDEWEIGRQMFDELGLAANRGLLLRAHLVMSLLALGFALAVYAMSRRLYGRGGALLSLSLVVLWPGLLGHGPLLTAETALSLFLLVAVWAMWAAQRQPTPLRLLGSGILLGCALVAKPSGALALPVGGLLAVTAAVVPGAAGQAPRGWRRASLAAGVLAVQLLLAVVVVWACYDFRYATMAVAVAGRDRAALPWVRLLPGGFVSELVEVARRHRWLPEPYLYGVAFQTAMRARPAFMNGEVSQSGWLGFFPYAFLLKTPLPTLLVLGLAGIAGMVTLGRGQARREAWLRTAPLWTLLLVYGGAAVASRLNSGYRHLLPLHGPLFVLAGAAWCWRPAGARGRAKTVVLAACVGLLAVEVGYRSPDHLAYFNTLAGGPAGGWRHLVDSSLDWGQDLPAIARASARRPGNTFLSYYGSLSPRTHGIASVLLPSYLGRGRWPALVREPQRPGETALEVRARAKARWPEHEALGWYSQGEHRFVLLLKRQRHLRLTPGTYFISATMMQPVYYVEGAGAWRESYERRYRELGTLLAPLLPASDVRPQIDALVARHSPEELTALVRELEWLRFARLTAYLRGRGPDEVLHGSVLVFGLDEHQLAQALDGAPAYGR